MESDNRNKIKSLIRSDFSAKLRPLLIKNKCEYCGAIENLELHHSIQFVELLNKAIEDLNINIDIISEEELDKLRTYMLGLQIQIKNITLCDKCHDKFHKENELSNKIKNNNIKLAHEKLKKQKETERQTYNETILKPYLESMVGKRLYKEARNKLIDIIDYRENGRQQKSYSKLNEGLKMLNLPYIILPKRTKSERYWVITKIEE